MTADQYRHHRTLAGPFLSGEIAGVGGGMTLHDNPYRKRLAGREPRRGSWSESCIRAWATGWREGDKVRKRFEAARRQAAPASSEGAST